MVLDVVAVIEEQPVVQASVMAGRSAGVFEMSLQQTQRKAGEIAGNVDRREEPRGTDREREPHSDHTCRFGDRLSRHRAATTVTAVMPQMTVAPELLRDTHERAEV